MALEILHDRRVRSIRWMDLLPLTLWETGRELLLPLPWLALSQVLAYHDFYAPALLASFMFFLTGLRLAHGAFHYTVGVSRFASELIMASLSVLMLGSMHCIQFHHLRHHRHCLDDGDIEAMGARGSAWQALLVGPWFPVRLHWTALARARGRVRRWIAAELLANAGWLWLVLVVWELPMLRFHVLSMTIGQCLAAFFAVWTVHHDCERFHFIARTLRRPFLNLISFNMFFHVEHHLFPKVPTCHLGRLAMRIDEAAPELQKMEVI